MKRLSILFYLIAMILAGATLAALVVRANGNGLREPEVAGTATPGPSSCEATSGS